MCPALSSAPIIAVSQLVTIRPGFSLVSQNCRSFTYQWADLSDKVTFAFRVGGVARGGAGAVKVSAGPGPVLGQPVAARGQPRGRPGSAEVPPLVPLSPCPLPQGQPEC